MNELIKKVKARKNFFLFVFIFAFLFLYLLFFLFLPFLLYNNLLSWDTIGLYFSAVYQKENLFPHFIGWNPYFFLGYPQNAFYPPMYSYLTSILSFIFPISFSFKLLFGTIVLIFPLSFYFFARSFEFSKLKSAIAMLLMSSLLFLFPNNFYGGNMHATFKIGLIAHALGMCLFFFYWVFLERTRRTLKIKKDFLLSIIISALILAAIVLSHIIGAVVSVFLIITYFFVSVINYKENKKFLIFLVMQSFLAFLITFFWTAPFLFKMGFSSAYTIGIINYPISLSVSSIIFLVGCALKNKKGYASLGFFVLFTIAFAFLGGSLGIPLHFYRMTLFLLVLIPFMALVFLDEKEFFILFLFVILGCLVILFSPHIDTVGPKSITLLPLQENLSGERVFVFAPYSEEPSPHILQYLIPFFYDFYGVRGLYVESAQNARFIFSLENQLEPFDSVVWGTYLEWQYINTEPEFVEKILPHQLSILGVNYIISPKKYFSSWEEIQKITDVPGAYGKNYGSYANYTYFLYKVGNTSLIEILNYTPKFVGEDWENKTYSYFLSELIKEGVMVNKEVPNFVGNGNEKLKIEEISKRQDYLRFKILNASYPVPVLVKISYFPNWKAYEIKNEIKKEIPIYKASPSIMLVYAQDEVEMKYEDLWIDKLGKVISLITFFGILAFFVLRFLKSKVLLKRKS